MLCSAYLWSTSLCHQGVRLAKVSASRAPPARLELGWDEVEYDNRYSEDDEMDAVQGTWTEDVELILGADMLLTASSSSDDDMDELQSLVGEWQEQQALADESGGPTTASQQVVMTQRPSPSPSRPEPHTPRPAARSPPTAQASMMESWRALLSRKERDLQRSAKAGREKKEASWVPAALTGWYEEGAEDETETLTTDEDAGSTEREDQEFVREWQLHAENQRQRQQGQERQERLAVGVRVRVRATLNLTPTLTLTLPLTLTTHLSPFTLTLTLTLS